MIQTDGETLLSNLMADKATPIPNAVSWSRRADYLDRVALRKMLDARGYVVTSPTPSTWAVRRPER